MSEKQIDDNVASVGSDADQLPQIDKAVERRLKWKMDILLMPALG